MGVALMEHICRLYTSEPTLNDGTPGGCTGERAPDESPMPFAIVDIDEGSSRQKTSCDELFDVPVLLTVSGPDGNVVKNLAEIFFDRFKDTDDVILDFGTLEAAEPESPPFMGVEETDQGDLYSATTVWNCVIRRAR